MKGLAGATRAYYRAGDGPESFLPRPEAEADWGGGRMQGPAVTGLLARAASRTAAAERPQLVPSRGAFELFRPALMRETRARIEIVRSGPRILLLDAFLEQGGEVCARGHLSFVRPGEDPADRVWSADQSLPVPAPDVELDERGRCYRTETTDWSAVAGRAASPTRKFVWQGGISTVEGEAPSGFERVCSASDLASMSVNWGERGVQHINTDVTVSLSRTPVGAGVGIGVLDRSAHAGVVAGAATVYDERGALGVVSLSAIAQTRVRVDCTEHGFVTRELG